MLDTEWRIRVAAKTFDALRADEKFRQSLVLGRALNTLRVLQYSYLAAATLTPPADDRQRLGAFFLTAATLYETLELFKRAGEHFRDLTVWHERIVPILRNKSFEKLFANSIAPLRDQTVFHFFEDSMETPVKRCDLDTITLVGGYGDAQGQVYYKLADLMALEVLIGACSSAEAQLRRAEELMTSIGKALVDLVSAAEGLLVEYYRGSGAIVEVRDSDGTWRAD